MIIRLLRAWFYSLIPHKVTESTAIREIWSIFPDHCRLCGKVVWGFYYDTPEWFRAAMGYGRHHNDLHCPECHHELMEENGYCVYCRQDKPQNPPQSKVGPDDGDWLD